MPHCRDRYRRRRRLAAWHRRDRVVREALVPMVERIVRESCERFLERWAYRGDGRPCPNITNGSAIAHNLCSALELVELRRGAAG